MTSPILNIKNLHLSFKEDDIFKQVLKGIDVSIISGKCTGIIGESGSGKSVTFLASIGLLSDNARIDKGSIEFFGNQKKEVVAVTQPKCTWTGKKNAIIFQEPLSSLNPTMTCGQQILEAVPKLLDTNKDKVLDILAQVQIDEPERVYRAYPHEISGGQRQRVMIAMALAREPLLLIADEPTTALDPKVQDEVLFLLKALCKERSISLVLISHDLEAIHKVADVVYVFNNGRVMEKGTAEEVFNSPKNNYTKALIESKKSFKDIDEMLPAMDDLLEGKVLHKPRLKILKGEDILKVKNLEKTYPSGLGLKPLTIKIAKGEVLAVTGRSGSGKSTFAKLLLQIERRDGGSLHINGKSLIDNPERFRWIQMVFQDPYSSLHPSKRVSNALSEVLLVHKLAKNKKEARLKVKEVLETVGLDESAMEKYPHQFSGGQRQRVSIARALLMEPEVLVMDEAVAALDLSIQAKIINLLIEIQQNKNLSFIFITHDIHVVEYFADNIAILQKGNLLHYGSKKEVLPILKKHFTSEKYE